MKTLDGDCLEHDGLKNDDSDNCLFCVIDRLRADIARLTARLTAAEVASETLHGRLCVTLSERDSLASRVKALRRSALEHASWLVCGMFEVGDAPQGMRLSGSARRWLANERIEVRDRLNNAAIAIRRDVDADRIAAPESKPESKEGK